MVGAVLLVATGRADGVRLERAADAGRAGAAAELAPLLVMEARRAAAVVAEGVPPDDAVDAAAEDLVAARVGAVAVDDTGGRRVAVVAADAGPEVVPAALRTGAVEVAGAGLRAVAAPVALTAERAGEGGTAETRRAAPVAAAPGAVGLAAGAVAVGLAVTGAVRAAVEAVPLLGAKLVRPATPVRVVAVPALVDGVLAIEVAAEGPLDVVALGRPAEVVRAEFAAAVAAAVLVAGAPVMEGLVPAPTRRAAVVTVEPVEPVGAAPVGVRVEGGAEPALGSRTALTAAVEGVDGVDGVGTCLSEPIGLVKT